MPERFDDLPVLAGLGTSLRAAMARAEAAEAVPTLAGGPAAAAPQARPEQHARRWRRATSGRFGALSTVLVLGVVGTAAAAATLTVLRGSPIPAPRAADLGPAMTARAETQHVLDLRATDPAGGAIPPFALRTGTSEAGQTCATVGQVSDGQFGLVGDDAKFRTLPATLVDGCGQDTGRAAAVAGARILEADRYEDVRSIVYGVGGDQLERATLRVRGERRDLKIDHGAVLAVVRGYPEDSALSLRFVFRGGAAETYRLGRSDYTVLDPSGPAWILAPWSMSFEPDDHVVTRSCVDLRAARWTPPAERPRTSPACGMTDARNNASRLAKPWLFDIKTFGPGDHGGGSGSMGAWKWAKAESRTVVWGLAQRSRVRRVTVTVDGRPAGSTVPNANHAFAIVLPPADVRHVRVRLDLRDGSTRVLSKPTNLVEAPR